MTQRLGLTSIQHQVPFHDIDITQRVWHGHYYKYFEMARSALFQSHHLEDPELVPGRYLLYIVESHCRHTGPLRYRDQLEASAWFRNVEHGLSVGYEIQNLTLDQTCARGHTRIGVTDLDGRLILRTPAAIIERTHGKALTL